MKRRDAPRLTADQKESLTPFPIGYESQETWDDYTVHDVRSFPVG